MAGLILSLTLVRDTTEHAILETRAHQSTENNGSSFAQVFAETSFRNPTLFSVSQAGLVNNLNDGMTWGLFPLLLSSYGLSVSRIVSGIVADAFG